MNIIKEELIKFSLIKDGIFNVSEGVPSDDPQSPNQVDNALEIATLDMPPYLYNIDDIDVQVVEHKRYQMKDIAELETRLTNVEYYTSLSLLETENLQFNNQRSHYELR